MSKPATKQKTLTNNSYFEEKIQLRIANLPKKKHLKVFEAYGGEGLMWDEIQKRVPDVQIDVLRCEIGNTSRIALKGDNIKFMKAIDLCKFDIIDLDAYGMPFKQMDEVFKQKYKGCVFVTYIFSGMFASTPPYYIIEQSGYTRTMIERCRAIFYNKAFPILKNYLAIHSVKSIRYYQFHKKIYLHFNLE